LKDGWEAAGVTKLTAEGTGLGLGGGNEVWSTSTFLDELARRWCAAAGGPFERDLAISSGVTRGVGKGLLVDGC